MQTERGGEYKILVTEDLNQKRTKPHPIIKHATPYTVSDFFRPNNKSKLENKIRTVSEILSLTFRKLSQYNTTNDQRGQN